jgi:hypothetical protein
MFYCCVLWQFFHIVAYNAEHFSALLPTTQKNVPRYYLQRQSFFRIVGNNAEKCFNFSSCVFFGVVADNTDYFSPFGPQYRKIICAVAYNVEKWSVLLATTRKNVRIQLSPRIRNHT